MKSLTREPTGIDELRAVHPEVCIREGDVLGATYKAIFPLLRQFEYPSIGAGTDTVGDIREQLEKERCHAILAPAITYRQWVNTDAWMSCNTQIVEKPVHASAGFAVPVANWCVARSFDYVLENMRLRGFTQQLAMEWFHPKACGVNSQAAATPESGDSGAGRRRRLAATAKAGAAAGGQIDPGRIFGKVDSASMTDQMKVVDFLGVFVLWGVASILALIVAPIKLLLRRKKAQRWRKGDMQQATSVAIEFHDTNTSYSDSAAVEANAINSALQGDGARDLAQEVQRLASLVTAVAEGQTTILSKLRERRRSRGHGGSAITTSVAGSVSSAGLHNGHVNGRDTPHSGYSRSRRTRSPDLAKVVDDAGVQL